MCKSASITHCYMEYCMWICEYAAKKERICNVMCYATILLYKPAVCMNWRQASEREREVKSKYMTNFHCHILLPSFLCRKTKNTHILSFCLLNTLRDWTSISFLHSMKRNDRKRKCMESWWTKHIVCTCTLLQLKSHKKIWKSLLQLDFHQKSLNEPELNSRKESIHIVQSEELT